jgi:hypothetical protein
VGVAITRRRRRRQAMRRETRRGAEDNLREVADAPARLEQDRAQRRRRLAIGFLAPLQAAL